MRGSVMVSQGTACVRARQGPSPLFSSRRPPPMAPVGADKKAPACSLKAQDGKTHKLSDFAGQSVVLYFYPKDDTPGCTKESCDFRDNLVRFNRAKANVLGI